MKFSILLLLSICLFQTVYSQADSDDEPAVLRKTGCSNPKFIAAELKAYQQLLADREKIEKWRADSITLIEAAKKYHLDLANRRYSTTLNGCQDAGCSTAAKEKYDSDVKSVYDICDKDLKTVRRKAAEKYEVAQDNYNKAVDAAIRLYCHSYTASGQDGPVVYSGTICSLEKPFTVTGTHPLVTYEFKFVPTSDTAGNFSYSLQQGALSMSGSGSYVVEGIDSGKPKIVAQTASVASAMGMSSSGGGPAHIDLTPLATNACEGK